MFICVAPNQNSYILPLQSKSYFPNIPIFTQFFSMFSLWLKICGELKTPRATIRYISPSSIKCVFNMRCAKSKFEYLPLQLKSFKLILYWRSIKSIKICLIIFFISNFVLLSHEDNLQIRSNTLWKPQTPIWKPLNYIWNQFLNSKYGLKYFSLSW